MTFLWRLLFTVVGALPLPLLHRFAELVGGALWWLPNDLARITRLHLKLCLPELPARERRRIGRESLRHTCKAVVEAPAIWFGPRRRLMRWLGDTDARQRLRDLLGAGHGAIILCPHIGSWELAGMLCASVAPMTSLYKPQKGAVNAAILQGRSRLGADLVPTTGAGVKALLQALRAGQMIGVLPDQDPPRGSGTFAPFFGIPAHTPELVTRLSGRTGAPVWFCYAERLPRGRGFRFHLAPAPADVSDPAHGAAALNRGIESVLMHLPEQYWWSYKRYRRQPAGARDFYRRAAG